MGRFELTLADGLGNRFVLVRSLARERRLPKRTEVRRWARLGRADQVLWVGEFRRQRSGIGRAAHRAIATMRVWNADGSTARFCGNGIRAVALWLVQAWDAPRVLTIRTGAGLKRVQVLTMRRGPSAQREGGPCSGEVRVELGSVRGRIDPLVRRRERRRRSRTDVEESLGVPIDVGNRHLVYEVASAQALKRLSLGSVGPSAVERAVAQFGPAWSHTNVEWWTRTRRGVRMRVWEHGVGETRACGSGACAVAVATWHARAEQTGLRRTLARRLRVSMPGGSLWIEWGGPGSPLVMQGEASVGRELRPE